MDFNVQISSIMLNKKKWLNIQQKGNNSNNNNIMISMKFT